MKKNDNKIRLAILASGNGSNAASFFHHFSCHDKIEVALVVSNKTDARVLERSRSAGIPSEVIPASMWKDQNAVLEIFDRYGIDAVVLAGYLLLIPAHLLNKFPGRIFNVHPALLPDFGGKGMYGMHVHKAVIDAGKRYSGITIHLIDEVYDRGEILFQAKVEVDPDESPETLALKVLKLEHAHFPVVVENTLLTP